MADEQQEVPEFSDGERSIRFVPVVPAAALADALALLIEMRPYASTYYFDQKKLDDCIARAKAALEGKVARG